ncbi:unnamed protein product [Caenorhabditis angaria]|uniref:Uncharacterized protein n=1 Tax=Caenorhabditis angaria TaxID=860376 RepID=A0A9P1IFM1_9PELO|nr:unnamed protein product [Caenorhabditis angaria]
MNLCFSLACLFLLVFSVVDTFSRRSELSYDNQAPAASIARKPCNKPKPTVTKKPCKKTTPKPPKKPCSKPGAKPPTVQPPVTTSQCLLQRQCKNVDVGDKVRRMCRKVKYDPDTQKSTVISDWEYEDQDVKPRSGELQGEGFDDGTAMIMPDLNQGQKQCEKINVGTRSYPKYRQRCRRVKIDRSTQKTTVISDWEYEDLDDGSSGGSSGASESNQSGESEAQKQCEKVNVGTRSYPKYRQRCRRVKIDRTTNKTTVISDWEYQDEESDGTSRSDGSGELQSSSGGVDLDNGNTSSGGSSGASESNQSGGSEAQKQCEKVNVGTRSYPKYRQRCRRVKIDRSTQKQTVISDWEYEDLDDGSSGGGSISRSDGTESAELQSSSGGISRSDEAEGSSRDQIQNQCVKVKVGNRLRQKCRSIKIDRYTQRQTVISDWEYQDEASETSENSSSSQAGPQKQCENVSRSQKRCRQVRIDESSGRKIILSEWEYEDVSEYGDELTENAKPRVNVKIDTDNDSDSTQQCETINIGTESNPKYRKRCRQVQTNITRHNKTTTTEWDGDVSDGRSGTKISRKNRVETSDDYDRRTGEDQDQDQEYDSDPEVDYSSPRQRKAVHPSDDGEYAFDY